MSMQLEDARVVEFDVRTDEMLVNMGPQHPSTHGVLRLLLRTDGEIVHEVTPHIGYLHRCAEKIGENLAPPQWIPYTDRMDYLAGMNMNLGLALAIEKLVKMEVPEKAMVLRVIIAEMGRVASHLVGMGAYGLDLGTFSPFLYAFREREIILDLFEEVCGARLTYSYLTMGGATHDLPEIDHDSAGSGVAHRQIAQVETLVARCGGGLFLEWLEPRVGNITRCSRGIRSSSSAPPAWEFSRRKWRRATAARARSFAAAASIGTSAATAIRSTRGCTRATSSTFPSRRFPRPRRKSCVGDNWCRFYVRMLELVQAIRLVRQAMDRYPTAQGTYRVPLQDEHEAAQGRGLSRDRMPPRPDGLLHRRQRRRRTRCAPGRRAPASATCRSPARSARTFSSATSQRSSDRSTS